jgi:hypothetical protein
VETTIREQVDVEAGARVGVASGGREKVIAKDQYMIVVGTGLGGEEGHVVGAQARGTVEDDNGKDA